MASASTPDVEKSASFCVLTALLVLICTRLARWSAESTETRPKSELLSSPGLEDIAILLTLSPGEAERQEHCAYGEQRASPGFRN
jgi:hypothetical protein